MAYLDEDLNAAEAGFENEENAYSGGAFTITVRNQASRKEVELDVLPENTLGQVFDAKQEELGIVVGEKEKVFFTNVSNGTSTTEKDMTIKDFEIKPKDVLEMVSKAGVA